jgi:hypothetical protein
MLLLGACSVAVFLFVGVPVAIREWWEDRSNDDEVVETGATIRPEVGRAIAEDCGGGMESTTPFVVDRGGGAGSEDATEPLPITRGG